MELKGKVGLGVGLLVISSRPKVSIHLTYNFFKSLKVELLDLKILSFFLITRH